jgi:hypothetical protein
MGLYLCIFDGDEEIDGVEVGPYSDFSALRDYIVRELEPGRAGSKYPTLILHSDCDGEWSVDQCGILREELAEIIVKMKKNISVPFASEWQANVARSIGLVPSNAFESFVDVDGEFVLERLQNLVELALRRRLPILFQ